jgi:hypothetical protein
MVGSSGAVRTVCLEAVLAEIRKGDPAAAVRRIAAAEGLQVLSATTQAQTLAAVLLQEVAIPRKAAVDAAHIAIAAVHGLDFLMTWNCTHIANAVMRPKIEQVCRGAGFVPPVICTPEELAIQEDT